MASKFTFNEQREQSAIKTEMVVEYFDAWAEIMSSRFPKIAYVDLYAGPGIYDDGCKSTPILILEKILSSEKLRGQVQVYLNEKNPDNYERLKQNVFDIPDISLLRYKPEIDNREINYNPSEWPDLPNVPTFCFLDPSGYYGLSQSLIREIIKPCGTDLVFFFNYNDINRAVSNEKVFPHMKALFGEKGFEHLAVSLKETSGTDREALLLNEMRRSICNAGLPYILPFNFKTEGKERTSHYIFFATRNKTGFGIMKDIMWKIGEKDIHGVATYGFISSADKERGIQLSLVDLLQNPYEQFKTYLCDHYEGRKLSVKKLYDEDMLNTPFVKRQYKDTLKELEKEGSIQCKPAFEERRKDTLADSVSITFLSKE